MRIVAVSETGVMTNAVARGRLAGTAVRAVDPRDLKEMGARRRLACLTGLDPEMWIGGSSVVARLTSGFDPSHAPATENAETVKDLRPCLVAGVARRMPSQLTAQD